MFDPPRTIIIFDTEYTTWEGAMERKWSGPGEHKEVVQIGAILVETENFNELDSFLILIRPQKNPVLSEYFITLTSITQEQMEKEGLLFLEAIQKFHAWCGDNELYSYGSDGAVLEENCALLGISSPFNSSRFHDARVVFERFGIPAREYMSSTIVTAFGRESLRHGHDALNDARTIADGLRFLKEKTFSVREKL